MSIRSRSHARLAALLVGLLPALAAAQEANPKFQYGKFEEMKSAVEWKAMVKAGLVYSTGNSQLTNFTAGFSTSRKDPWNKIALDGTFAYARSSVLVFDDIHDAAGNPTPDGLIQSDEVHRSTLTSAKNWNLKARYDRFFTKNNSVYAAGFAGADYIAGKDFVGGGQIGYSRQILKAPSYELLGEIGYDIAYEKYITPDAAGRDSVAIHSARLFLGGSYKLRENTIFATSIEVLTNLSRELVANWQTGSDHLPGLEDTRVNYKAGVTTKLWKNLSLGVTFTLKYDNNPALRPAPSGLKYDETNFPQRLPDGTGNHDRFADRLDTITEVVLIVNFI